MTNYSVDFFIDKFQKIDESSFIMYTLKSNDGRSCSLGLCGVKKDPLSANSDGYSWNYIWSEEGIALTNLVADFLGVFDERQRTGVVANINDCVNIHYQQETPKARILAALYDIKAMQEKTVETPTTNESQPKEKIVHVYHKVEVPNTISEQAKELIEN